MIDPIEDDFSVKHYVRRCTNLYKHTKVNDMEHSCFIAELIAGEDGLSCEHCWLKEMCINDEFADVDDSPESSCELITQIGLR